MTVTKEMIEAAARAMCDAWCYAKIGTPDGDAEWKSKQDQYRKQAEAALSAALYRSAEAGKPVVKGLEWDDRTDGDDRNSYANTSIGRYEAFEFRLKHPSVGEKIFFGWRGHWTNADQPAESFEAAKAAAQADYEARVRSALSTPADSEPVLFVSKQQLASCIGTYLPTRKEREGNFQFPLYASPMGSCEPEDWHCSARQQGTAGGSDPADCDWPLCGCDPYADKVIAALDEVGYAAPVADIEPDDPMLDGTDGAHPAWWRGCDHGYAKGIAAAPQPNPSAASGLTQQRLQELLEYSAETGEFTNRFRSGGRPSGSVAGSARKDGYVKIRIDSRAYYAHRLAWLYVTGSFPVGDIDHLDGDRSNNRFANLRDVSRAENNRNHGMRPDNTSGFPGVSFRKSEQRWQAQIQADGKRQHLGLYATPEEAHAAYSRAASDLGFSGRHILAAQGEKQP